MKNLIFIGMVLFANVLFAQDVNLKVEVSTDSVLFGNYIEVRFTIENAGGDFEAPEFDGFDILSGPNTSSSFSMINGNVTQEASYSYLIKAKREGLLYIDPASFTTGDKVLETEPLGIMVHPNPAGIENNRTFRDKLDRMDMDLPDLFKQRKVTEKKKTFEHKKRKI